ncbi:MAG: signal recognition particle-docking protein FtsY, partial [Pseudobdellovibrio sp.]|nr:signal recognition particle-docking protein FtsY [Pseudobdellovibrio sp.]
MNEAQSNLFLYLIIFIAFLFSAIVIVVLRSQFKKDKKAQPIPPAKEAEDVSELTQTKTQIKIPGEEAQKPSAVAEAAPEAEPDLHSALKKTEENFFGRIRRAFLNNDKKVVLEAVEEILYTSDLGPGTVEKLLAVVEDQLSGKEMAKIESVKAALRTQMIDILSPHQP